MDGNKALRYLKYALAAPAIAFIMRHTTLLDGSDDTPVPAINFAGGGDFRQIGDAQVNLFVSRAGLMAHDRVLDIGCGMGRIALALHRRFPELNYAGFDIVRYGICWAQKKLKHAPSYALTHADVANAFYNPRGSMPSATYQFPFASATKDLVVATSVFTHLLEPTARNYLCEISRCLAPQGRAYITSFIADGEAAPNAALAFRASRGRAAIASEQEPEMAVAYSTDAWREMADANGLRLDTVFRGYWRNDGQGEDFQDAVLLRKVTTQK